MGTLEGCGVRRGTLWGREGHPWGLWGGERDPMGQQWAPMGAVGWGEGPYGAGRGTHGSCGAGIGTLWGSNGHPRVPPIHAMGQRTPIDPIDLSVRCGRANCRKEAANRVEKTTRKPPKRGGSNRVSGDSGPTWRVAAAPHRLSSERGPNPWGRDGGKGAKSPLTGNRRGGPALS